MNNIYYQPDGRPFYRRLPSETPDTYQGNQVVDWLTNYWDNLYRDCAIALDDLPRQFDPSVCDPEWLDFLAAICGFTAPYWDKDYPVEGKRLLLKESYTRIWSNKGSLDCLSFVLRSLGIDHKIVVPGSFIIGQSPLNIDLLGQQGWRFKVILPIKYSPNGGEVRLTQKMVELFSPCWCDRIVEIDQTAIVGEFILSSESNTIVNIVTNTGVFFRYIPGNFRAIAGTFRNPQFEQEETYLKLN